MVLSSERFGTTRHDAVSLAKERKVVCIMSWLWFVTECVCLSSDVRDSVLISYLTVE